MLTSILFLIAIQTPAAATEAPRNASANAEANEPEVEKTIVYKKDTTVDLSGAVVEAENQLPPAFFLSKMQTPDARGILADRLRFSLRHYNDLGF